MATRVYGVYMSTPPTLSDGEIHPVLLDANGRIQLGGDLEINIGNVGILDKAEAEIEPAGGQKSNVAAAAADQLAASGLVRKDTRALPEAVANGDWVAMQGTATGDLRTRDDDANTDLDAMVADLNELTAAPVKKTLTIFVKTATSGTQVALVAAETFCRAFSIQAKKVGGNNTGNVFIGAAAVSVGDAEVFDLTPGSSISPDIPAGVKIDLNEIFIDVDNTGDGVVGWYVPV